MVAPSRALALLLAQSSAALQLLPLAPPPSRLVPSATRPAILPGHVARHATSVIACADHDGDDDDFDIQVSLADTETGLSIECNLMETMDMDGSLFAAMTCAASRPPPAERAPTHRPTALACVALRPKDTAVTIATLETDMMVEIDDEKELDTLFDAAKAAAADEGITLLRTAVTLTAVGELTVRATFLVPQPSSLS